MATISTTKTPAAVSVEIDVDADTLTLIYGNGQTRTVNPSKLNTAIRTYATFHGLKQKLVDAAAIPRNLDTGRSATLGDKISAVDEVLGRITSTDGTWNKGREGGTADNSGLFLRAMVALTGKESAEIKGMLDALTDEERKALRGSPKVAGKMAELRTAASKVDVDAVLAKFGFDADSE